MTPAWLVSTIRTTQTVKDISLRLRAFPQNSLFHISLLVAHWGCDFIMLAYYWFLYWLIHIVSFHLWNNQAELLSLCYGLRKCGIERLWVVPYHWVNSMSQLKKKFHSPGRSCIYSFHKYSLIIFFVAEHRPHKSECVCPRPREKSDGNLGKSEPKERVARIVYIGVIFDLWFVLSDPWGKFTHEVLEVCSFNKHEIADLFLLPLEMLLSVSRIWLLRVCGIFMADSYL